MLRVGGSRERTYAAACATNEMVPLTRNGGVGVGLPPFPKASCGPLTLCPLTPCAGTGLLWATNGGRVVEIHRDWASIELAGNGSQRIFDRRRVLAGDTALSWIEQDRRPREHR